VASAGSAKVIEHEITGLIVPNGDVNAFAAALVRLVDDPSLAARLAENARVFAQRHCRWELAAERLEAICDTLLKRPAESPA
jgi:glycosyltransferase involved in cell wall biosynthesis